jgi:HlyD family secretion protein
MKRLLQHWRALAAILVVAGVLSAALWPESIEVDVVRASRGPLVVTIDEEGETRVHDRFVVSAPVSGRLQRVELEPGDRVARGRTVLARLQPAPPSLLDTRTRAETAAAVEAARAALGQAQAERSRGQATLARARAALKRQQELFQAGLVPPEELETAQTTVQTAEEAARAAEFSVTRAQFELESTRARLQGSDGGGRLVEIVSPIDGVVLKRLRESEAVVPTGEPLLEIGDPTRLEIVSDLLSTDAVKVSRGQAVQVEQWGGGQAIAAHVRLVEPSGFMKVSALGVEEQRVNVIIDFADTAAAARLLGDGYRVEVRIVIAEKSDVVKVPIGAVFREGERWAVFAARSNTDTTAYVAMANPAMRARRLGTKANGSTTATTSPTTSAITEPNIRPYP